MLPFLRLLLQGLHRLPPRFLTRGPLFRLEALEADPPLLPGAVVDFVAPTSFSTRAEGLVGFRDPDGPRTVYVVSDGVGYDLREFSPHPEECEVLAEGVLRLTVRRVEHFHDDHVLVRPRGNCFFAHGPSSFAVASLLRGDTQETKKITRR